MQLTKLNNFHQQLAKLGLTLNESEVLWYLLQVNKAAGPDIFRALKMDKSSCYRALKLLLDKNLIYKLGEERNQTFYANPPEKLLSFAQQQQEEIEETTLQLRKIVDNLKTKSAESYRRNITVIDGKEGYSGFLESRLVTPNLHIREIGTFETVMKYFKSTKDYSNYMHRYIDKRVKQNITLQSINTNTGRRPDTEVTSTQRLKEVRLLPRNNPFDALLTTWGDKTGFFSKEADRIICVTIDDPFITDLINYMFDFIWPYTRKI